MDDLNVLLAGRDNGALKAVGELLARYPGVTVNTRLMVNGSVDPLEEWPDTPDALVVVLTDNWQRELTGLEQRPAVGRPPMVVVGPSDDVELMRLAMRSGARDFLSMPVENGDLESVVSRLAAERRAVRRSSSGVNLVAVVNAKGGAGSSFIATNLAVTAAANRRKTVAVDLDLQAASLPLYFDVDPNAGGLVEALERASELDELAIDGYLMTHHSGVRIIAAPPDRMLLNGDAGEAQVRTLMELLGRAYDRVIVDVPRGLDEISGTALGLCQRVFVVVQQSVSHIRDAKRMIELMTEVAGVDEERLVVVVNRWNKKSPIGLDEIKSAVGNVPVATIPNDYERVSRSVNTGIPLVELESGSAVARAFTNLAEMIDAKPAAKPRRLLGGLLSWRSQ